MTRKIFKYQLSITGTQVVQMPPNAIILTVQMQGEILCLWALVDLPLEPLTKARTILLYGTGHPIEGDPRYLGTFQVAYGELVFHVFEENPT